MSADEKEHSKPPVEDRSGVGRGMRPVGMPVEQSKDFRNSTFRLIGQLKPERIRVVAVIIQIGRAHV